MISSLPIPSPRTFFKSLYYSNTYLPAVDLSEQGVARHLLKTEDATVAATAQALISQAEVQKILSEPLSYDSEETVPKNNDILGNHGFKLLSTKRNLQTNKTFPFYSVIERPCRISQF